MLRRDLVFTAIATCLLVLIGGLIVVSVPDELSLSDSPRTEKSERMEAPFGYPDKFAEMFAEMEGVMSGYDPPPHNNKMTEFRRAQERISKRKQSRTLAWSERGPGNVGGRTRAVVVDPGDPSLNTFYVGAVGGGLWKAVRSVDLNGQEVIDWTPLTDYLPNLNVSTLTMAESNPDIMYLGTGIGFYGTGYGGGIGIFKTTDRGNSWTQLASTAVPSDYGWRFVNRIAVDPNDPDVLVVATNRGIYRSVDGGDSFNLVYDSRGYRVQDLQARPDNFDIQFAGVNSKTVLRSTDGGLTWSESLNNIVTEVRRIELAIAPSNPDVVYAAIANNGGSLYRTIDGGNSWYLIEDIRQKNIAWHGGQGWHNNSIAVHPFSPDTVYLGGIKLWKTWMVQGTEKTVALRQFNVPEGFVMEFVDFNAANFGQFIQTGFNDDEIADITSEQATSIEVRFGEGSQKAHRFAVSQTGGHYSDGGGGIDLIDYQYRGYVDVPFQVWDTDNNRQLMVSFRDQADDGVYNLIERNTSGERDTQSREYLFIHRYDYDDTNPQTSMAADGGLVNGMMYFMWPYLADESTWDPLQLPKLSIGIDVSRIDVPLRKMERWNDDSVHVDHHNLTIIPIEESANEFYVVNGNDGGLAYSRDGGETWIEGDFSRGYNTSQFYDATKRPGYEMYLGGTQDNGTFRSNMDPDAHLPWREVVGGDGFDVIWKGKDSLIASVQYNSIRRSLRGRRWERATKGMEDTGSTAGQFYTNIGWSTKRPDHVFVIGQSGVWHSTDFADSWELRPIPKQRWQKRGNGRVRVSLADPNVVWAGYRLRSSDGQATLQVSTDGGNTFSSVTAPSESLAPISSISGLATHPVDRNTAYVMYSVYSWPKILRTTDLGTTWEDITGFVPPHGTGESTNGFPNVRVFDVEVFPEKPNLVWAGTGIGLFESTDHGKSWHYADNGLPTVGIWRIRIVDDEIVLATHGRGIWSLDLSEVQRDIGLRAETFGELEGNYPNPFNPSTMIVFKVSFESHVNMTVFDVLGRRVATLTDQAYSPGRYLLEWDAEGLASGQYFYRMEVDGAIIGSKSMHLIK